MLDLVHRILDDMLDRRIHHLTFRLQMHVMIEYIHVNDINVSQLGFELLIYFFIEFLKNIYNCICYILERPFTRIMDIYKMISHVSFASVPKTYRHQMYKTWLKGFIIDLIKFSILTYLLYRLQLLLMW